MGAAEAGSAVQAVRAATDRPFNVNVFCHDPAIADPVREAAWIRHFAPEFAAFGASPPAKLAVIYRSFIEDEAMLAMLLAERPAVMSVHFGLPGEAAVRALKAVGIALLASATSLAEARAAKAARTAACSTLTRRTMRSAPSP